MSLKHKSLIIGGQPKAGTSSLFHWLSHHPDIAPSNVKEARFFLDRSYPLPSSKRYTGSNEDQYLSFFKDAPDGSTLLDASPDYLYCQNALKIPHVLPNSRIVFIVRDPVERVISWFKFSAQIGRLAKGTKFSEFVEHQLKNETTEETPIHLRALEQNRVAKYLPPFKRVFGDQCLVLDFDAMKADPKLFVKHICLFSDLDPTFFDDFDFTPQNVSKDEMASRASRVYYRSRAAFNYWLRPSKTTINFIRPLASPMKRFLSQSTRLEPFTVSPELECAIRHHAEKQSFSSEL